MIDKVLGMCLNSLLFSINIYFYLLSALFGLLQCTMNIVLRIEYGLVINIVPFNNAFGIEFRQLK